MNKCHRKDLNLQTASCDLLPGIGVYNYGATVKSAAHELTIRATAITREANSTSAAST